MKEVKRIDFWLNNTTRAGYTLIYDQLVIEDWANKCLATLKAAGKISEQPEVKFHDADVGNFACIEFGWEYKLNNHSNYPWGSFVSEIYYIDLLDIVGINADGEVDLTTITDKQKLEIIKKVMSSLWEAYKSHV